MQRAISCLCAVLSISALNFAAAEAIIYQPNFVEPESGPRGPTLRAVPTSVLDGDIVFIRYHQSVYAVKFLRQTMNPEQAHYEYLKVGSGMPPVTDRINKTFPGGLFLDFFVVPWSGRTLGTGYVYLTATHRGLPPAYEIGEPFYSGELQQFSKIIPPDVHFESLPDSGWSNVMAN